MKRKLFKGIELFIMAGFLVTAVGRTVHATENKINDNIVSGSEQKQDESGEKSGDIQDDDSDGKKSGSNSSKSENDTSDEKDTDSSGADLNVKSDDEETVDMDRKDSDTDTSDNDDTVKPGTGTSDSIDKTVKSDTGTGGVEGEATSNENIDDKDSVSLEGSKYESDTNTGKVTDTDDESDPLKDDESKKTDSGVDVENSDTSESATDMTDEETGEAVGSTEDLEETLAEETVAETEAIPEETIPVETTADVETLAQKELKKTEYLTMEDIEGLWSIDDSTSYRFTKNGTGALVLPEHSYSFDYKLDEDILEIDFEKKNLRDSTFEISVVDGIMNLRCLDEYFENEYELQKED